MHRTPKQGRKLHLSAKNGVNLKKKTEAASTPKNHSENVDSPPWLSRSPSCDSAPSPIPFLCTQDGSSGDHDVVWNYYSPTSEKDCPAYPSKETPIRKRKKKFSDDFSPVTRLPLKKNVMRPTLRKKEFLKELKEELLALNKNVQGLICSDPVNNLSSPKDDKSFSAPAFCLSPILDGLQFDDVDRSRSVNDTMTTKPRLKNNHFDKVSKCDSEGAIESDDSMNEFLLKASQLVEDEVKDKLPDTRNNFPRNKFAFPSVKLKSKFESSKITNDSFENIIGNMNDSEIEILTQASHIPEKKIPQTRSRNSIKAKSPHCPVSSNKRPFSIIKADSDRSTTNASKESNGDSVFNNISNLSNLMSSSILNESKSKFGRHRSMPESPTAQQSKRLKGNSVTSGFSRHNTMPDVGDMQVSDGLSQVIRCTPEEIKKKHQAAREKLLARKQDPLSRNNSLKSVPTILELRNRNITPTDDATPPLSTNILSNSTDKVTNVYKNPRNNRENSCNLNNNKATNISKNITGNKVLNEVNIQEEIERKRREALQKLQMKKTLGLARK